MNPDTLFSGRSEFQTALRATFVELAEATSREIWLCDEDFSDWPLGDKETIELLTRWARSNRRMTLLARHFGEVARRHARWVRWRRDWSHIVTCRTNVELGVGDFPSVLLASGTCSVRLTDTEHHRGVRSDTAVEQLRCKEMLDAVLQRSEEGFPATVIGL